MGGGVVCGIPLASARQEVRLQVVTLLFSFFSFFSIVFTTPSPTLQKNIDIQTFPKLLMGIARDKLRSAAWVDVDETRRRGRGSNGGRERRPTIAIDAFQHLNVPQPHLRACRVGVSPRRRPRTI
jgi:hypothetical protein